MKDRIEKLERKIKILKRERESYEKELHKLLYPIGIFRILNKRIRREALQLQKAVKITDEMIEDLNIKLEKLKNKE